MVDSQALRGTQPSYGWRTYRSLCLRHVADSLREARVAYINPNVCATRLSEEWVGRKSDSARGRLNNAILTCSVATSLLDPACACIWASQVLGSQSGRKVHNGNFEL